MKQVMSRRLLLEPELANPSGSKSRPVEGILRLLLGSPGLANKVINRLSTTGPTK